MEDSIKLGIMRHIPTHTQTRTDRTIAINLCGYKSGVQSKIKKEAKDWQNLPPVKYLLNTSAKTLLQYMCTIQFTRYLMSLSMAYSYGLPN